MAETATNNTDSTQANSKSPGKELLEDEELKNKITQLFARMVPYDPRFPNQNQTRNCHVNYIDYFRCLKKKDEDYCAWYKNAYTQLCPPEWIEKWDEQRENGTFPVRECM